MQPIDFSYLFGRLRGISDRALAAHLAIYRKAYDRLAAIDSAFPMVEWRAADSPSGDATTQALLRTPVGLLDLRPTGLLAEQIATVNRELTQREVSFQPAWYLGLHGDDFWTADRGVSINIPWCYANPALWRLANRSSRAAYTPDELIRTLRHEAGHAICYAFEIWRAPDWQRIFGDSRAPYRDQFTPVDGSRDFVEYLTGVRAHYAQKHPDEDFAEAFACWLDPTSNWKRQYAEWPVALSKLEYIEECWKYNRFSGAPPNMYRGRTTPYRQESRTVAAALEIGTATPALLTPNGWSEHAELLRAEPEAYNDVVLHESHFQAFRNCIGKVQPTKPSDALMSEAVRNWGTWDSYMLDLRLCCAASDGGWALTVWDERRARMRNAMVYGNGAVPAGCRVLLALDTHEHAYALDYGIAKYLGIAAQLENIDWTVISSRLDSAMKGGARTVNIAVDFETGDPDAFAQAATEAIAGEADDENEYAGEGWDNPRQAAREGLIAVMREVTRYGKTHNAIYWIRPEKKLPGDRHLDEKELKWAIEKMERRQERIRKEREPATQGGEAKPPVPKAPKPDKTPKGDDIFKKPPTPKFPVDLTKLDWHGSLDDAFKRNEPALVQTAQMMVAHVGRGKSDVQGVSHVEVGPCQDGAAAQYSAWKNGGTITILPESAERAATCQANQFREQFALHLLVHEAVHGATKKDGDVYESPWILDKKTGNWDYTKKNTTRPFARLQEAATDMIAHHHVQDYVEQHHWADPKSINPGKVSPALLFVKDPFGNEAAIAPGRSLVGRTGYPAEITRLGQIAHLASGLQPMHASLNWEGDHSLENATAGLSYHLKGIESKNRYRELARLVRTKILEMPMKGETPEANERRALHLAGEIPKNVERRELRAVRKILMDHMDGKGPWNARGASATLEGHIRRALGAPRLLGHLTDPLDDQ